MTHNRRIENSAEHHEVSALLPWYVNETLEERDRQRVDAHVGVCAACREDLAAQRRICEAIEARARARLHACRLAQTIAGPSRCCKPNRPRRLAPPTEQAAHRACHGADGWRPRLPVMAVAVALLAADRWVQIEARRTQPNYRTVTSSAPRPQGEVIRAVFSPTITLVELQTILDEAQLRIVSGPTEAGVYSLASNSTLTVRASLALLRRHSTVRFAEGTLPEPESGNSP